MLNLLEETPSLHTRERCFDILLPGLHLSNLSPHHHRKPLPSTLHGDPELPNDNSKETHHALQHFPLARHWRCRLDSPYRPTQRLLQRLNR